MGRRRDFLPPARALGEQGGRRFGFVQETCKYGPRETRSAPVASLFRRRDGGRLISGSWGRRSRGFPGLGGGGEAMLPRNRDSGRPPFSRPGGSSPQIVLFVLILGACTLPVGWASQVHTAAGSSFATSPSEYPGGLCPSAPPSLNRLRPPLQNQD